jgi:[acyl-carrier-protein] S-malonyltransferase
VKSALIFPGQGSQKVGMAAAFINGYKAGHDVVSEIEDAISIPLLKIIEEGSLEDLTQAEIVQPAIFAVSMSCIAVLEHEYGYIIKKHCKYLAGHSLGEYSALCVAGVFSVADCAKIVCKRGELMAKAINEKPDEHCMVALLGVCATDIEDIVASYSSGHNVCVIANDNSPTEVVISGHRNAVGSVIDIVKKSTKLIRAVSLKTAGAFHSPLMANVAIEFDAYLHENINCRCFDIPVIMNLDAVPLSQKEEVYKRLIQQITGRVCWRQTCQLLADDPDIDVIAEVAPGNILSNMLKRTYRNQSIMSLETVAQLEDFVNSK